jgi:hypothetical protein
MLLGQGTQATVRATPKRRNLGRVVPDRNLWQNLLLALDIPAPPIAPAYLPLSVG